MERCRLTTLKTPPSFCDIKSRWGFEFELGLARVKELRAQPGRSVEALLLAWTQLRSATKPAAPASVIDLAAVQHVRTATATSDSGEFSQTILSSSAGDERIGFLWTPCKVVRSPPHPPGMGRIGPVPCSLPGRTKMEALPSRCCCCLTLLQVEMRAKEE